MRNADKMVQDKPTKLNSSVAGNIETIVFFITTQIEQGQIGFADRGPAFARLM